MSVEYGVCPRCGHDRFFEHAMISTVQRGVRIIRTEDEEIECDYDRCAAFECDYNDTIPVSLICECCDSEFLWDNETGQYAIPEYEGC